jgi:hypothetical protein
MKKMFWFLLVFLIIIHIGCGTKPKAGNQQTLVNGEVTVNLQGQVFNVEHVDNFFNEVNNGREAKVQIKKFTDEGDPILQLLEFDGKVIKYTFDNSQDKFAGTQRGTRQTIFNTITKEEGQNQILYYLADSTGAKTNVLIISR